MSVDDMPLLAMAQICDSAFPSGAFSMSNGLETLVQFDQMNDPAQFERYLADWCLLLPYRELGQMSIAMRVGNGLSAQGTDALDDGLCWRASVQWAELVQLDRVVAACNVSREIREATARMCSSVRKITSTYGSFPLLVSYGRLIDGGVCRGSHAIVVGLFAASIHVDPSIAAVLYGYSLLSALTVCAVKCVPLKQSDGQRILYDSRARIAQAAYASARVDIDQLGVSGPLMELASMQHETLYSRLFMS